MPENIDICTHIAGSSSAAETITAQQVKKAIETLNRGKAADIYGVVAEHVLYGGDLLIQVLTNIINSFLFIGSIPDSLKAKFNLLLNIIKASCRQALLEMLHQ